MFETDRVGNVAQFSKSATKCCASSLLIFIYNNHTKMLWNSRGNVMALKVYTTCNIHVGLFGLYILHQGSSSQRFRNQTVK